MATEKRIRIILDSKGAEKNAKDVDKAMVGVGKSADKSILSVNKLSAAIASYISVSSTIGAVKAIAAIGDEYAKISGLLKIATSNQEEFNFAFSESKRVAEATRAPLTETVETYAAIERATKTLGKSQKEIFGVLETVNKSIALTSPSAQSAQAALTQFGQALGGDFKAGAQELNSILEQTPGLAIAIADGLGVPTSALKQLGEDGELSAEKVFNALEKMANQVDEKFTQIPKTISSTTTLIKNDLLSALGDANVSAPLISALEDLRETLNDPAVRDGLINLSSGIVTLSGWVAKLATDFVGLGQNIGYFAAKVTGGVSELDELEKTLKELDQAYGKSFMNQDIQYMFMSDEEIATERENIKSQIALITGGFAQIKAAKESAMPIVNFSAPNISAPDIDVKALLREGYQAEEKEKRQHLENMRDIEKEFLAAVDREAAANDEIAAARNVTSQLQIELDKRIQISQIYRDQALSANQGYFEKERAQLEANELEKVANIEASAALQIQRREEQLRQALDNENLENSEKLRIKAEYDLQKQLQEQISEEQLTAIREQGKRAREELDRAEYKARLESAGALGSALMSLGQGQSKKIFKIGQTLALAQAAVALPTAVLESFRNGGGYPWGLIPAGAMLATGLKNIQAIRSAGAGLGGGGGGGSIGASVGGGATGGGMPTGNSIANAEQFKQKQVIEVRGIGPDSLITGAQLVDILQKDDNVIVALSGAQQDAQRRGVI